ncbi:MAG TPA: hypothetical protein VMB25_22900 [Bryobacteraceae bacterium]|nr:hypothetical protein [Bryobacteraceae bacterium]
MGFNTGFNTRMIGNVVLGLTLTSPALRAADATPWDTMKGRYGGIITVTTVNGRKWKHTGTALFSASEVTLLGTAISVPRAEVKEVVIREWRSECCDPLVLGVLPLLVLLHGAFHHNIPKDTLPYLPLTAPLALGIAGVTGPPLLVIEGARRLKPAKVLYRVVP